MAKACQVVCGYEFEGDFLFYADEAEGRCCYCGDPTHFISIHFESYLCSDDCVRQMKKKELTRLKVRK
jgi:hypothetical protein